MPLEKGYVRRRGKKFNAQTDSDFVDFRGEKLTKVIDDMESIVKEKSNALVYDTIDLMVEALSDEENKGKFNIGTSIYIVDSKVSDKWITEKLEEPDETGMYYKLEDLESENISIELIEILEAGETEVVFESEYIMPERNIDVYTSVEGLGYVSIETSRNKVIVTYPAQSSNVSVKLVIS